MIAAENTPRPPEARLITSSANGESLDPRGGRTELETVYRSWIASRPHLGGYSQGAAVMGFVTPPAVPDSIPPDVDPASIPKPLSPDIANHVAAVVLFGAPNVRAMNFLGQPAIVIGPLYQSKTIKVCAPEDPICSDGMNFAAHDDYLADGRVIAQGVDFAANHLGAGGSTQVATASPSQGFGS